VKIPLVTDERRLVCFQKTRVVLCWVAVVVVVEKLKRKQDNWILRAMSGPRLSQHHHVSRGTLLVLLIRRLTRRVAMCIYRDDSKNDVYTVCSWNSVNVVIIICTLFKKPTIVIIVWTNSYTSIIMIIKI